MDSSNTYSLSIRCFSNGFSFSVRHNALQILSCNKIVGQDNFCTVLEQELSTQHLTEIKFQHIECVIVTPTFTLVPTTLYREQDTDVWLRLVRKKISLTQTVCTDSIERYGCTNLYEIPLLLLNLLKKTFPQIQIMHAVTYMLANAKAIVTSQPTVLIDTCDTTLTITVLINGKLQLANSYAIKTHEDIAYWTLRIYEQFSLNQEDTLCYWHSEYNQEAKQFLSKYIKIKD